MSTNPESVDERLAISEQAAAWRVTLGAHDTRRLPEFWNWVTRSPEHVREALTMGLLNGMLRDLDPEGRIPLEPPSSSQANPPQGVAPSEELEPERRPVKRWALAAAVLMACLAIGFFSISAWVSSRQAGKLETYTTDIGQQRTLTLVDGSTVVLDTQSRLQVQFSATERAFRLDGQALFNVAHDQSRPFRVHTAATTVEATGTSFDVRTDQLIKVAVLQGAVRVYPQSDDRSSQVVRDDSATSARVEAGEAVSIASDGRIADRSKVDRASITAWREFRLVFSRTPLEDIVREFNRYRPKGRMRVEGHAASLRFGGVFDAVDPSPLLFILAQNHSVVVDHDGNDVIIRDRR